LFFCFFYFYFIIIINVVFNQTLETATVSFGDKLVGELIGTRDQFHHYFDSLKVLLLFVIYVVLLKYCCCLCSLLILFVLWMSLRLIMIVFENVL
jgi:hypothetical protein